MELIHNIKIINNTQQTIRTNNKNNKQKQVKTMSCNIIILSNTMI